MQGQRCGRACDRVGTDLGSARQRAQRRPLGGSAALGRLHRPPCLGTNTRGGCSLPCRSKPHRRRLTVKLALRGLAVAVADVPGGAEDGAAGGGGARRRRHIPGRLLGEAQHAAAAAAERGAGGAGRLAHARAHDPWKPRPGPTPDSPARTHSKAVPLLSSERGQGPPMRRWTGPAASTA